MDFDSLTGRLRSRGEFGNLDDWTITKVTPGRTSRHTYRFRYRDKDYFVKEVSDREQNALRILNAHRLHIAPPVIHPQLLAEGILVTTYITGGQMRGKRLSASIIRDYAAMQNALNSDEMLAQKNPFNHCRYNDRDDGTFRNLLAESEEDGRRNLAGIRAYAIPIAEAYDRLADHLRANRERIAEQYSQMPFGWLHNDFREENIVGEPPVVVDWGSSYGHGPFLHDLAPFLLVDEAAFSGFLMHSDHCQAVDRQTVRRWLYAAGWARFASFLRWHLEDGWFWQTPSECQTYLAYEYAAWQVLETDPF